MVTLGLLAALRQYVTLNAHWHKSARLIITLYSSGTQQAEVILVSYEGLEQENRFSASSDGFHHAAEMIKTREYCGIMRVSDVIALDAIISLSIARCRGSRLPCPFCPPSALSSRDCDDP